MANMFKYQRSSLLNTFTLVVGILLALILLSHSGEGSPSTSRHKVQKSANRGLRTSRSAGNYNTPGSMDRSGDFNTTLDPSDEKLCSVAGSDRPACRKAGLDMKSISLELIRQAILKKLRMDENKLPNITIQSSAISRYLSELVDMQGDSPTRDDTYDDEHATTEKIIAFSTPAVVTSGKQTRNVHSFQFSEKMSNMKIEAATLYVHVRFTPSHHHGPADKKNSNFNFRIMESIQTSKGESPMHVDYGVFKSIHRQDVGMGGMPHGRHNRSKWIQIDIRDALSKWVSTSASRKIILLIEAVDNSGNRSQEIAVVSPSVSDVNSEHPFIEVLVSDGGRSRQPRNIGMACDENSSETRCCKYPLTVDFEEFGWDWIIAPKKYDANYCSGECPFAFLQKYPHNHIVQQAVPSGVGGPCCAARKMSSISMLYFDSDSNIVYSVLPGMVVEKCGCS